MYISMATAKEIAKQNRHLFQEMPFYGVNFTQSSNPFENLSTKKQLDCLTSLYDLDLYSLILMHQMITRPLITRN